MLWKMCVKMAIRCIHKRIAKCRQLRVHSLVMDARETKTIQAEACRQLVVCTECLFHTSDSPTSSLSVEPLFGHITGKSIIHGMLLIGIKVYMYGRVLLIDISDYTIYQVMQTTLDASESCTVTTSCLRLTSTNCQDML
ncbi:hypothetical protein EDC96DRAFT_569141 [Choanephora cucurbitarum]|nr:hypothetical protein EDC96DRAFT_569141 [Choanephora cucurbitarum]